MGKVKISAKRKKSLRSTKSKTFHFNQMPLVKLKKSIKIEEHHPDLALKNTSLVREALVEAFFSGDVDGFKEILASHLRAVSKDDISKKTGVSRATVFRMLDRRSNPSFENVVRVVRLLRVG